MVSSPARSARPHASLERDYRIGSTRCTAVDLSSASTGPDPLDPTKGRYFLDSYGRRVLLHGVNVSGLNKLPSEPNSETHLDLGEAWYDGENVSFVGRPWPLAESDTHLSRLRNWGFTFIRLVVPWEALEHAGPGQVDEAYETYLEALISLFPKYGMKCYIDAHQDVWSRHTGGSGAPTWTLQLVGLDIRALKASAAAHAHNLHLDVDNDPPPKVWPAGMTKLAAATMATVFWGGNIFAGKRRVKRRLHQGIWGQAGDPDELVGLQTFLQESMLEAFGKLADRLKACEAVMGFEVINEPHRGYISLHSPHAWDLTADLAIGYFPSAAQSWALGAGHSVKIPYYVQAFPVTAVSHQVLLTPPDHRAAWLPPPARTGGADAARTCSNPDLRSESSGCLWQEHGVWCFDKSKGEFGEPVVLKMEYFRRFPQDHGGRKRGELVNWERDCYFPFVKRFGERMRRGKNPSHWITFVEPIPNELAPEYPIEVRPPNMVLAPHWYDLQALFEKRLGWMSANVQGLAKGMFLLRALYFGRNGLRKNYAAQIANILSASYRQIGEIPVVLGETGCPFDLNGGPEKVKRVRNGDWRGSDQERMVDAILHAIGERGLASYNLWNYNPLNTDEWGDSWNGENFSWYSATDATPDRIKIAEDDALRSGEDPAMAKLNVGARVLDAIERPYPVKTAGIPLRVSYDFHDLSFSFAYINPIPPVSTLATTMTSSETLETRSPDNPPIVGFECLARETEVYLPKRRYGKWFKSGAVTVKVRDGDGEWRWDEELQTLYVLHVNQAPGYIHTVDISVERPPSAASPDRPSLLRWYEPRMPLALARLNINLFAGDWIWLWALLIATIGIRMGYWLLVGGGPQSLTTGSDDFMTEL
ncbi:uncharacterized protein JCM15063_006127 [Sporobolomyces koalae]|uniref:uncharacterized protein n=1 Tax=Sporobolomyces koalae TaxID=500713 RepID=UPI00317E5DEB